MKFIVNSSIF